MLHLHHKVRALPLIVFRPVEREPQRRLLRVVHLNVDVLQPQRRHRRRRVVTMCAANTTSNSLQWDVLTIKRPGLTRDLPAGKEDLMWVANSSTLISGERDAVLVDTLLTTEQSKILLDWVVASGKNLTAIYVTHGHGDHFFGLASLLERFPRAKAVATPEIVKAMHEHLSPAWIENFWRRLFPARSRANNRWVKHPRPRHRSEISGPYCFAAPV